MDSSNPSPMLRHDKVKEKKSSAEQKHAPLSEPGSKSTGPPSVKKEPTDPASIPLPPGDFNLTDNF